MRNYCPECEEVLSDSKHCKSCGWHESHTAAGAPTLDGLFDELVEIMQRMSKTRSGNRNAAASFLNLLEPQRHDEQPRQLPVIGGKHNEQRWLWPYAERIKQSLRKYMTFTQEQRQVVRAAKEDGISWRGDDIEFFMGVIDETMEMREMGVYEYRQQAIKQMKSLLTSQDRVA